jgi:hypothetical protein
MAAHAFDLAQFQARFPELAALAGVTSGVYWDMATQFMSPEDGCMLTGNVLQFGLELLTAHLAKLGQNAAAGNPAGPITSAAEGSVNVALAPPPFSTGWQFWLSSTGYGAQLWALLQVQTAGGLYVGGSLERQGFRGAGGVFVG